MLGKLTIDALPFYSWVAMGGAAVTVLGAVAVMAGITWFGWWRPLFRERSELLREEELARRHLY